MALWQVTKTLPPMMIRHVPQIYKNSRIFLPIEVRIYLCSWIEKHILTDIDADNPKNEDHVDKVISTFFFNIVAGELEGLKDNEDNLLSNLRCRLQEVSVLYYKDSKPKKNVRYFKGMRKCLYEEMRLLAQRVAHDQWLQYLHNEVKYEALRSNIAGIDFIMLVANVNARIEDLRGILRSVETEQKKLIEFHKEYEKYMNLVRQYNGLLGHQDTICELHNTFVNLQYFQENKVNTVNDLRNDIVNCAEKIYNDLSKLIDKALEQFEKWKTEHKLAANGGQMSVNLDALQQYYELSLACGKQARDLLYRASHLHEKVEIAATAYNVQIDGLCKRNEQVLRKLLLQSIVVEEEPPQIIYLNTPFSASLRLLTSEHLNAIQVIAVAYFINEHETRNIFADDSVKDSSISSKLLNGQGVLEFLSQKNVLMCRFKDMIVTNAVPSSGQLERHKFRLAFKFLYILKDNRVMEMWLPSLVMVVVTSLEEAERAEAIVTWDNAFADNTKIFNVPCMVPWDQYAEVLSMKFKAATGRGFTDEHILFIYKMIFGADQCSESDRLTKMLVEEKQHDTISRRYFTFWEWFCEAVKLIQEHLSKLWKTGLLEGFITATEAENKLRNKPVGSFMILLREDMTGAITIVWYRGVGATRYVSHFKRYKLRKGELMDLPIKERLKNLSELKYFYPSIVKEVGLDMCYQDKKLQNPSNILRYMRMQHQPYIPFANEVANNYLPTALEENNNNVQKEFIDTAATTMDYSSPSISSVVSIESSCASESSQSEDICDNTRQTEDNLGQVNNDFLKLNESFCKTIFENVDENLFNRLSDLNSPNLEAYLN